MNTDRCTWLGRLIAGVTLLFARCSPAPAYNPPRAPQVPDLRSAFAALADSIRDYPEHRLTCERAAYLHQLITSHAVAEYRPPEWMAAAPVTYAQLEAGIRSLPLTIQEVEDLHGLLYESAISKGYDPELRRQLRVELYVNAFRGLTMTVAEVDHAHYLIDECAAGQPGKTRRRSWLERDAKLATMRLFNEQGMPICGQCLQVYDFDLDEPFAHCDCGTCEWGNDGNKYRGIQWKEELKARLRSRSPLYGPERIPDAALQETIEYFEGVPPYLRPDYYEDLLLERSARESLGTFSPHRPGAG